MSSLFRWRNLKSSFGFVTLISATQLNNHYDCLVEMVIFLFSQENSTRLRRKFLDQKSIRRSLSESRPFTSQFCTHYAIKVLFPSSVSLFFSTRMSVKLILISLKRILILLAIFSAILRHHSTYVFPFQARKVINSFLHISKVQFVPSSESCHYEASLLPFPSCKLSSYEHLVGQHS
jgi:hypothetical protein